MSFSTSEGRMLSSLSSCAACWDVVSTPRSSLPDAGLSADAPGALTSWSSRLLNCSVGDGVGLVMSAALVRVAGGSESSRPLCRRGASEADGTTAGELSGMQVGTGAPSCSASPTRLWRVPDMAAGADCGPAGVLTSACLHAVLGLRDTGQRISHMQSTDAHAAIIMCRSHLGKLLI